MTPSSTVTRNRNSCFFITSFVCVLYSYTICGHFGHSWSWKLIVQWKRSQWNQHICHGVQWKRILWNLLRQSFSLFLHLSEEPREVHADDVLKSEKALRYYSYLRNRQFQIHGNDRQQCLRSIVYPFAKKVYISIERGLLFDYPCSRCLAIPEGR